jgi:histidinol-phosphate aminotransferase
MTLPQPRQAVANLSSYRPPLEGRRDKVRLDFNENTVGFGALLPGYPSANDTLLTTYPEYETLHQAVASMVGVNPQSLLLTNGSDEALNIIPNTFIEPKVDRALCCAPTFAMIPHSLHLAEAHLTTIPLTTGLAYDTAAIEAALTAQPHKLVMIASPDNPTGALLPIQTILAWCTQFPATLFVMDEAYHEYLPPGAASSALPHVANTPNLLVTRTFSKAWGLAGLRLGYIVAHPQLVEYLKRVQSPYSINTLAVDTALKLIPAKARVLKEAQATIERRDRFVQALESRGFEVHVGGGNFFLLRLGLAARQFVQYAAERGVLVRNQSHQPLLDGWVRVSTGTEGENQTLLQAVDGFLKESALIFDLDDTLVDTSRSFDVVVEQLVSHYCPAQPLAHNELLALRTGGGFNDDWDATVALLARRGMTVDRTEVETLGCQKYLAIAKQAETLLLDVGQLHRLARRYRLFIFTGRKRAEYAAVWGEQLDPLFEAVYCSDDIAGAKPKPAPDYLCALRERHGLACGWYVGNSVDDMAASVAAGFEAIGVTKNQPAADLSAHGARHIFATITECVSAW